MTRKLEDLFNMPESESPKPSKKKSGRVSKTNSQNSNDQQPDPMEEMKQVIEKNKSSSFSSFEAKSDIELDDIALSAKQTYDDLMDLGMNVDSRYSARIFEVASAFLKISLDAKSTKVNKVLRSAELQIKQERNKSSNTDTVINSDHVISDRNSLLAKLKNLN